MHVSRVAEPDLAQAKYGMEWLDVKRIFPTKGAGTSKGWHYKFPAIEVTPPSLSHTAAMHDGRPQESSRTRRRAMGHLLLEKVQAKSRPEDCCRGFRSCLYAVQHLAADREAPLHDSCARWPRQSFPAQTAAFIA